jgi:hypothetical protein
VPPVKYEQCYYIPEYDILHEEWRLDLLFLRSVRRLLVTARVVPSSILVTLMKEALSSVL